ncbi:hypothetical protein QCA50_001180 [Cerrena zonata]|uniref:SEP-domain-containing protein n=1 Tax=Cerrena zonata TaxID=2478898 RepID=A0AAW0H035_9APHY
MSGNNTPRTLGGDPVDGPTNWPSTSSNSAPRIGRIGGWGASSSSSSSSRPSGGGRIATLRDIASNSGPGPSMGRSGEAPPPGGGHAHGEDDDEEDDDEEEGREKGGENWYAGGERSGLSVQNPNAPSNQPGGDLVRDLLRRASRGLGPAPEPRDSIFSGGGHRLGSDEVESEFIPDPNAPDEEELETVVRHLTLWRDGFSIEDGELLRYGDERNESILADINSGRAPPSVVGVEVGQPVELRVVKRLNEDYVPPPPTSRPFGGAGHRLGSPLPGAVVDVDTSMPGSFPGTSRSVPASSAAASAPGGSGGTKFEVDQTKPTTSVQVRLADGTRMICQMNLDHTVRDIRNFINASRPENNSRAYTIGTTFPNRVLEDDSQTIQNAGLVKGVVVQRWL